MIASWHISYKVHCIIIFAEWVDSQKKKLLFVLSRFINLLSGLKWNAKDNCTNMIRHHVPLPCLGKHAIFVKCAIRIDIQWQVSLSYIYEYVDEKSILKYIIEIRSILDHGISMPQIVY